MFEIWCCKMISTRYIVIFRKQDAPSIFRILFVRCVCYARAVYCEPFFNASTIFQKLFYPPWDNTHIPHISVGIHATEKIQWGVQWCALTLNWAWRCCASRAFDATQFIQGMTIIELHFNTITDTAVETAENTRFFTSDRFSKKCSSGH